MKTKLYVSIAIFSTAISFAQKEPKSNSDDFLKEVSTNACKCVDSINVFNKVKANIASEIGGCIDKQTVVYQMGVKLMNIDISKESAEAISKKEIRVDINTNESSKEYKTYYYEIERFMMANCSSMKDKIESNEMLVKHSYSEDKKAQEFYSQGLKASEKQDYAQAVVLFEKAVKRDPKFSFAWDNLGVNYRRLNNFDKAIEAYNESLKINPDGLMPLQNIAIVYQYKKEYDKAINAYIKLATVDVDNPEVYYGMGVTYALSLNEYEKGLENACKAYNIYVEQKSPYRSDAEKLINTIYSEMKKQGKETKFNEILEANNINSN